MADDPLSRLEFAKGEIDRLFGSGFSRDHPELTAAVMLSASLDFHGLTLARAVRDVAVALLEDSPGVSKIGPPGSKVTKPGH
jgi:hypothetical protein